MAKPDNTPQPLSHKQRSRRDKERIYSRWLIIGAALVLTAVVLVLGWGLYDLKIAQPHRPVAVVNGDKVGLDEYQRYVQYYRLVYQSYLNQMQSRLDEIDPQDETMSFMYQIYQQQVQTYQSLLSNVGTNTLQTMIEDRIIRQEAARRGIVVTDEDVQTAIEEQFNYYRNPPTPTPTLEPSPTSEATPTAEPTMTPEGIEIVLEETPLPTPTAMPTSTPAPTATPVTLESFEQQWASYVEQFNNLTGFTEEDYRYLTASGLYSDRVQEAIEAEAPTTAEQVRARHILVATEEEARAVIDRFNAGEDFAALAEELSTDTGSAVDGGELGWFTRATMVEAFSDAAFSLEPGQVSEPVETQYGFHVIQVEEHEMDRELTGSDLTSAQSQYYQDWLTAQTQGDGVESYWTSDMVPATPSFVQ